MPRIFPWNASRLSGESTSIQPKNTPANKVTLWPISARTSTSFRMARYWPLWGREAMENQPLLLSHCEMREHLGSTDQLIREWLFRFGVEHKEDVAPR